MAVDAPRLGFTNPKIQRLRRLLGRRSSRYDEGALVIEGAVLAAEARAAGLTIAAQFVAPGVTPLDGVPVQRLEHGVAERVTTLESSPGLFAVVVLPERDPAAALAAAQLVVVADGVAEPGNLGTIARSAEAAGFDAIVTTPGTVDWTNPKVIRASAGAVFHVPVITADLAAVGMAGLRRVGTSSHHGVAHTIAEWAGRVAVVVGNEAHGLADDADVDEWLTIPHAGRAESLNVAMAATVVCFEALRQRRG